MNLEEVTLREFRRIQPWARRKKWKKDHTIEMTKIPNTKRRKYGMNKTKIGTFDNGVKVFLKVHFNFDETFLLWH